MKTTLEEIKQWAEEGLNKKASYMIVVCDTYDYEDYPVYVMPEEDLEKKKEHYDGNNMQRIMEVYDLAKPIK